MNSCEFTFLITSLACCISEGKTAEELAYLAAILVQLGDTLAMIAARDSFCQ